MNFEYFCSLEFVELLSNTTNVSAYDKWGVWAQSIGALATAALAFLTYKSVRESSKQREISNKSIDELKKQRLSNQKPLLYFNGSFYDVYMEDHDVLKELMIKPKNALEEKPEMINLPLKLYNIGFGPATEVTITVCYDFENAINTLNEKFNCDLKITEEKLFLKYDIPSGENIHTMIDVKNRVYKSEFILPHNQTNKCETIRINNDIMSFLYHIENYLMMNEYADAKLNNDSIYNEIEKATVRVEAKDFEGEKIKPKEFEMEFYNITREQFDERNIVPPAKIFEISINEIKNPDS